MINPKNYFKLENGQIVKHLHELPHVIEIMEPGLFNKYVNAHKNDFAKWVYDIFGLDNLSSMLGDVKSKQEMTRILNAYLKQEKYNNIQNTTMLPAKTIMKAQEAETVQIEKKPKIEDKSRRYEWKNRPKPQEQIIIKKPVEPEPVKEEIKKVEKEIKKQVVTNTTDADEYFEKNPQLLSQVVDAKKKNLEIEVLKRVSYLESEKPEKIAELFKDTYTSAYERLVFLRKSGFDTKLCQVMLFRIPSKIKIYDASKENKDAIIIKRYLNEIIEELNNIKR